MLEVGEQGPLAKFLSSPCTTMEPSFLQEVLFALAESTPHLIWSTDTDGNLVWANQRFWKYLGTDRINFKKKGWEYYVHANDHEKIREKWMANKDRALPFDMEFRLRQNDGLFRWMIRKFVPLKDDYGRVFQWIGTTTDIHEVYEARLREKIEKEKAQETESRLILALEASQMVIWDWDVETGRLSLSKNGRRVWGKKIHTQEDLFSCVHPEDVQFYKRAIQRLLETGESYLVEFRIIRPDTGEVQWMQDRGYVSAWRNGKITSLSGVSLNIDERKTNEEALKEKDQELRLMIQSVPQIVWITDVRGSVQYFNQRWYDYTGTNVGDAGSLDHEAFVHTDDLQKALKVLNEAGLHDRTFETEIRIRRFDGVYRWHLVRSVPIKNSAGEIVRWFGTSTDIHDQKVARDRIYSLLTEAPAQIAVVKGPELKYEFSNHMNNEYIGWTPYKGQPVSDFTNTLEDGDSALRILQQVYQSGETYKDPEFRVVRNFGSGAEERFINYIVQPTRQSDGKIDGLMVFAIDVTDQVRARQEVEKAKKKAEEASKAKSEFLANMSHEIRTPLGAILGFAELALESSENLGESAEYLERIRHNGQELLKLIGDILDLSKVEANCMEVESIEFSLLDLVDEVAKTILPPAQMKKLDFSYSVSPDVPNRVISDPTKMRQILLNLLNNSLKFTHQGGVHLAVKRSESNDVLFEVRDTGIGMTPKEQERLFQPFSQADSSTTRKYGGTGLGLVLSRKLSQALGGELKVIESIKGQGSVFQFSLQIQSAPEAEIIAASQRQALTYSKLQGCRVLLVEDAQDNRLLISKYLQSSDIIVDTAENGELGIQLAFKNKYDAVLMDIQMPIMDGYQAVSHIRQKNQSIPIVALTAHAMKEEKEKALSCGFSAYLTKPIRRKVLLETLESVLSL